MTRKNVTNLGASIRQRLQNHAQLSNRPFDEILRFFAMERFLYRLSKSAHADRFTLKGALMLRIWDTPLQRPTMDIDLLGRMDNDIQTVESLIREICTVEVEPDGIIFDPTTIVGRVIREDTDYEGVRIRFQSRIDNARVTLQLDIAFDPFVATKSFLCDYPTILDLPAPRMKAYSREATIAEKFQAMVYLGSINSRMKDFYDIWLLSRHFDFDGNILADAIKATFEHRRTPIEATPLAFTPAFSVEPTITHQWRAFITKNHLNDAPVDFAQVTIALADFLSPVSESIIESRHFNSIWKAPGPWR
ncbi:nucleotidyl transferase AbiEii/AbiGii toxin family protein [candidate division Kazan bacterium]|uniref:Nucleotidyl transferase AbiEii/AbiGii toxin family protein n=1 Tax=candidate division Kazan bacterium TaxID=2202143 RepID=A0A420ZC70_UNCK3|nr:MAG: nucleotidyl transferase AbiEii/AbiGii toxin family protein [candidate division Kazan bacterium]